MINNYYCQISKNLYIPKIYAKKLCKTLERKTENVSLSSLTSDFLFLRLISKTVNKGG